VLLPASRMSGLTIRGCTTITNGEPLELSRDAMAAGTGPAHHLNDASAGGLSLELRLRPPHLISASLSRSAYAATATTRIPFLPTTAPLEQASNPRPGAGHKVDLAVPQGEPFSLGGPRTASAWHPYERPSKSAPGLPRTQAERSSGTCVCETPEGSAH
jgi:hypothetical protein